MLNGLGILNVELTSRCNKSCWMCGRRQREKLYGDQGYGDMPIGMVPHIANQVPKGILVQLHNNGETLVYSEIGKAITLFKHCITNIVSNGKLIMEKADQIIGNLDILTISIIENDDPDEKASQFFQIEEFLKLKKGKNPHTMLRFVGDVDEEPYKRFKLQHVNRTIHLPEGSVGYRKEPVIPEHGICLDFLSHLAIDRFGNVSMCVRFDPEGELKLGNIEYSSLSDLWNGEKRKKYMEKFIAGKRKELPFCNNQCNFWGIARGRD
jgi:radical SAM protein with 4Fe4S-binding SPASM domain